MGNEHVQVKFQCKEVDPCENSRIVHISPHSSGTVIDSEKFQLTRIESRLLASQRAVNQRCVSPLTSPKWGLHTQNCHFCRNFYQKQKSATKFHCLKTSSSLVVAQSTTYRTVSIFWQGMTPFPIKFGPKGTDPDGKGARFTFHMQRAVQSAIADLVAACVKRSLIRPFSGCCGCCR